MDTLDARDRRGLVDVAPLERERLLRAHPCPDEEDRESPIARMQFVADRLHLVPGTERAYLAILV